METSTLKTFRVSLMPQGVENKYDYMLIDTAPGIADNVLYLNTAVQEIMVVLTPDPSSLTDAYALIKVLHERHKENRFSVVCNLVHDLVCNLVHNLVPNLVRNLVFNVVTIC